MTDRDKKPYVILGEARRCDAMRSGTSHQGGNNEQIGLDSSISDSPSHVAASFLHLLARSAQGKQRGLRPADVRTAGFVLKVTVSLQRAGGRASGLRDAPGPCPVFLARNPIQSNVMCPSHPAARVALSLLLVTRYPSFCTSATYQRYHSSSHVLAGWWLYLW